MDKGYKVTSEFFERQQWPDMCEYRDFTVLSKDGFAVVYKVRRFGRWYVLKALGDGYRGKEPYESLLRKDFEIGITLCHPNIVRYIDFVSLPGYGNAICMEYVDGQCLDTFVSSAPPLKRKLQVFSGILDGVEYLHMHQVVHRDLKPSNVIVGGNGDTVRIIDLELADRADFAILKEPAGTRGYAAPEMIYNGEHADSRADIYSLGMLLTDMHLPSKYSLVIGKCTKSEKGERYQNIMELRDAMNRKRCGSGMVVLACAMFVLSFCVIVFVIARGSFLTVRESSPRFSNDSDSCVLYKHEAATVYKPSTNDKEKVVDVHPAPQGDNYQLGLAQLSAQAYNGIDEVLDKYKGNGKTDTINLAVFNYKVMRCTEDVQALLDAVIRKADYPNGTGSRELYSRLVNYSREAIAGLRYTYHVRELTAKEKLDIKRRYLARRHKADSVQSAAHSQDTVVAPHGRHNR